MYLHWSKSSYSASSVMETLYYYHSRLYIKLYVKLTRFSILEKFPNYMQNVLEEQILNSKRVTKKTTL